MEDKESGRDYCEAIRHGKAMKLAILLLRVFACTWVALAFLLVIAGLHPFSVTNYVITIIAFAPALVAFVLASCLEKRSVKKDKRNGNQYSEKNQPI
jgi:Flp pilus assembly protein TadB